MWPVFLFGAIGGKNKNRHNMRPRNTVSNSVINGHIALVVMVVERTERTNITLFWNIVPGPLAGAIRE